MDLSTGSIGWHRTRQWLDSELERLDKPTTLGDNYTEEQKEYYRGYMWGQGVAYMRIRSRFNTLEESQQVEETRREMFG